MAGYRIEFDYYPFGMLMPGRSFSVAGSYRYGFNGKEKDNELSGDGNQYDYSFRIYNPRIGRFLSVDPLFKGYPWYTPYQFAGNKPIIAIDLDGLEEVEVELHMAYQRNKAAMNNASALSKDPEALACLQQIKWNAVLVRINEIVSKHFDPTHNVAPVTGIAISKEIAENFLFSQIAIDYVSVTNYAELDIPLEEDVLEKFRSTAEMIANDHYRSSFFWNNAYNTDVKKIGDAKDPNEKARLIEERYINGLKNWRFYWFSQMEILNVTAGFMLLAVSETESSPTSFQRFSVITYRRIIPMVEYNGGLRAVYRGGNSLTLKASDYKTNPSNGFVKTTYGLSLDVKAALLSKFGGAYRVDYLPPGLRII